MEHLIKGPLTGYKITNDDMTCSGYQFALGVLHTIDNDEPLKPCNNGFHYCPEYPGVGYYYKRGRIFKIEAYDVLFEEPYIDNTSHKRVCRSIKLVEEITYYDDGYNLGKHNTGSFNEGNRNTGNGNKGHDNAGYSNIGHENVGDSNVGNKNTGDDNIGDYNTGNVNIGDYNIGEYNLGDNNNGCGNVSDGLERFFCSEDQELIFFDKPVAKTEKIPWELVDSLARRLHEGDECLSPVFLNIPNATPEKIANLVRLRKERINKGVTKKYTI